MGIRMASQARVPMVCKLPVFNRPTQTGWVASAVMGTTFAVGCLSCFSATVLTALLLYAGASGSPIAGGLIMLMFSAGVGVIFLLAAILMARAAPVATWLTKAQPVIGVVSAIVMITLGALMITYKFHTVTGYLFRVWS
jgi:cytochrome c-type biogenesis protein